MSFWQKLFSKEKKNTREDQEWLEILLEEPASPEVKRPGKAVLDGVSGKLNTLETQEILAEYCSQGWDVIRPYVGKMAMGKIPAVPWALGEIFKCYPKESASLLLQHMKEMPKANGMMLLAAMGEGQEDMITTYLLEELPKMEREDLSNAFRILSMYPTKEGKAALYSYLDHEDWRIAMKAATGLAEAKAEEYLPQLREKAAVDGLLGKGIGKIVERMTRECGRP